MRALIVVFALLAAAVFAPAAGAAEHAGVGAEVAKAKKSKKKGCARHSSRAARKRCAKRARCLKRAGKSRRARRKCAKRPRRREAAPKPPPTSPERAPVAKPSPAPAPPVTSPSPPLGRYVSVATREFSLTLSRPAVAAGSVTLELRNPGEDPHNLIVSPDDGSHEPLATFDELPPGGITAKNLDLPRGRYYLWCSLPVHELLGMSARLRAE